MNDLATFVVINVKEKSKLPEELMEALKKNGWMMVRENSIFALPWKNILEMDGSDVPELMKRIENVRVILRKLRLDYRIDTMGANQVPT